MTVTINRLEIENVKRIKAVKIEPSATGLTIVGGNNNQGKTSVLDAIAWALGGNKYKPSQAQREGSQVPPTLKIVMSNGLIVERKGKTLRKTHPIVVSFLQNGEPVGAGTMTLVAVLFRRIDHGEVVLCMLKVLARKATVFGKKLFLADSLWAGTGDEIHQKSVSRVPLAERIADIVRDG